MIENAWTNVCRTECERLNSELKEQFTSEIKKKIKLPLGKEELKSALNELIEDKRSNFAQNALGEEQVVYEKKLS